MRKITKTQGKLIFPHRNIMTPGIVAFYEGTYEGKPLFAELSIGKGFLSGQPIHGVTFARADGSRLTPDPSKCFFGGIHEAEFHIQSYLNFNLLED